MRRSIVIAVFSALVLGGSLAVSPSYLGEDTWEKTCMETEDSEITILPMPTPGYFTPECLQVQNQEQITWINEAGSNHDPGDGVEDGRETAFCFQAAVDIEDENHLPPGHTYSIELRFDTAEETLYLAKAWHNGERQDLNGADDGLGTIECEDLTWDWVDDDTISVDYICHIYDDRMSGEILMDV